MKIEVYSIDNCPYCTKAKHMLQAKGYEYENKHLTGVMEKTGIIQKYPTARTFPIIVIDDKYIGGSDDLESWLALRDMNGMDL